MTSETPWYFDATVRRYRGRAGTSVAGKFIGPAKLAELRDTFIQGQMGQVDLLAQRLADGELTLQQWVNQVRGHIKTVYLAEYMLGKGGKNNMTQSDYGRLGAMLKSQYGFLNDFAADIAGGHLSVRAIIARSQQYVSSATLAHERGKIAAWGLPSLPAYPGDGSSECKSNDKCRWDITQTDTEWRATWRRSASESCDTCVDRSSRWSPLIIPKDPILAQLAIDQERRLDRLLQKCHNHAHHS